MPGGQLEMLATVLNLGDSRWIIGDVAHFIPLDRVICPGAVPKTVNNVHVLFRNLIALIVGHEVFPKCVCCSFRPAGHDIPGDSAFGQVIQAAEGARERKGGDVACASSHSKRDRSCYCLG